MGDMAPDALVNANARVDGFRLLVSSIAANATKYACSVGIAGPLGQVIERKRPDAGRGLAGRL